MPVSPNYTPNEYTADGVQKVFPYTFRILESSDLKVYANGVETVAGFSVDGVGVQTGGNVTYASAPANGVIIRFERATEVSREIDYTEGSGLSSSTLDEDFDRIVMMIQDTTQFSLSTVSGADNYNANNNRIINLSDPVDAQDAATKKWAETAGTSFIASADAAASNASTSATNAATSETNAATSAINASTSASNAATSETNAATSAINASTSASNAATSETNAATSATNAAASFDSFDDRYLGAWASAPSVSNDGDALIDGALYWNSTSNTMYAWDLSGATWVSWGISPTAGSVGFTPSGNIAATDVQSAIAEVDNEKLANASNLSDLADTTTARTNLDVYSTSTIDTLLSGKSATSHTHSGVYEPADADILKADTSDNLVVGYTTDVEVLSSDTIAPDMSLECIKTRITAGNITINFPTGGNGVCYIVFTIDGTDRTVTLGANVKSIGTIPTLTASTTFLATVIRDTATHAMVQIQKVEA